MIVYIVLATLPIFISFFLSKNNVMFAKNKRQAIPVFVSFFVLLFLILSFRGLECGVDLTGYYNHFQQTSNYSFQGLLSSSIKNGEYLYYILNWIIVRAGGTFRVVIVLEALCVCLSLGCLFIKESKFPLVSIALFLVISPFSMFFSGLRQSFAISIGILCFALIKNKRIFLFLLMCIVAMFFHKSAFILLFLLPLYYLKLNRKTIPFIVFLFVIAFAFRKQILTFLMVFISDTYGNYQLSDTGAYSTLILLIMLLVFCFVISKDKDLDRDTVFLRNILIFSIFIQMFASVNNVAMRFNYYFLVFVPVLIPRIIVRSSNKETAILSQLASIVFVVFFTGYFIYKGFYGSDIMHVFPYVPFWDSHYLV